MNIKTKSYFQLKKARQAKNANQACIASLLALLIATLINLLINL